MATRLRLLGSPQVFDGAEWFVAPHDKRFALLAFLARTGKPVPRERLAFLFWPDVEEARARRDLRHLRLVNRTSRALERPHEPLCRKKPVSGSG